MAGVGPVATCLSGTGSLAPCHSSTGSFADRVPQAEPPVVAQEQVLSRLAPLTTYARIVNPGMVILLLGNESSLICLPMELVSWELLV